MVAAISSTRTDLHESKARRIGYWITTSLVSLNLLVAGVAYLAGVEVVRNGLAELGYPAYVMTLLGACKVLGGLALLAPGLPRLAEWAYAGIVFNLVGAALSHAAVGHPTTKVLAPLVVLAVAVASWALRPPSRRFDVARVNPRAAPTP